MKTTIITSICALIFANMVFAQIVEGEYHKDLDFINFNSDSVNFQIKSNDGLIVDLHSSGTYDVFEEYLIIKAGQYQGINSTYSVIENKKDIAQITVADIDKKAIIGVNVFLYDNSGNLVYVTTTNENGIAIIENKLTEGKITLSLVGYDTFKFNFSNDYNYRVKLMNFEIIENKTVIFKINTLTEDSISLTLLTTDFKCKRNQNRALKELERKSQKNKNREIILIKE